MREAEQQAKQDRLDDAARHKEELAKNNAETKAQMMAEMDTRFAQQEAENQKAHDLQNEKIAKLLADRDNQNPQSELVGR